MRRRGILSIVAFAISLMASVSLQAQGPKAPSERARHWEIGLDTRYQFERRIHDENGSGLHFTDDFSWGFNFGYNVNERILFGADFGWNNMTYTAQVVDVANPSIHYTYSNGVSTGTALLFGEFRVLPKRLTPIASGAVGWGNVVAHTQNDVPPGNYYDPWFDRAGTGYYPSQYDSDALVYRLGGGVRYDTGRSFVLKLQYNSQWADELENVPRSRFDQIRLDFGSMF